MPIASSVQFPLRIKQPLAERCVMGLSGCQFEPDQHAFLVSVRFPRSNGEMECLLDVHQGNGSGHGKLAPDVNAGPCRCDHGVGGFPGYDDFLEAMAV